MACKRADRFLANAFDLALVSVPGFLTGSPLCGFPAEVPVPVKTYEQLIVEK